MASIVNSLRAISDPTRLRLLLLLVEEELTVAELQEILGMGQSRISASLALLKREAIGRVQAALAPSTGEGDYLNFAEEQVDVSRSFDTDTWARLVAVKDRVDPLNLIHANHAI